RIDAFTEAQRAAKRALDLERDVSVARFLRGLRLPARTRDFARMMVEGFDAADPRRASMRAIAEEWGGGELGGSPPRPQGGYGALLDWLGDAGVARGGRPGARPGVPPRPMGPRARRLRGRGPPRA